MSEANPVAAATDPSSRPQLAGSKNVLNKEKKVYDSKASLNKKKKGVRFFKPRPNPIYADSGVDEIIRLTKLIDDQKDQLRKYSDELKTLKIVNARQDKAISKMDKDHLNIPKVDKLRFQSRMMDGEKRERRQLDEIDRLKAKLKDYTAKLSVQGTADLVQLKEENTKLQTKIDNLQKSNEELEKKLKLLQVEKDRNLKVGKTNHQKTVDTVEALQSEIQKLNQKLNEKDKQINSLSIYTTHAAERAKSRSQSRARARTAGKDNETTDKKDHSNEPHPFTDSVIASILNKPIQNTIHKPDLRFKKSEPAETVDDILARRMREQLAKNSSNNNLDQK